MFSPDHNDSDSDDGADNSYRATITAKPCIPQAPHAHKAGPFRPSVLPGLMERAPNGKNDSGPPTEAQLCSGNSILNEVTQGSDE